MKTVLLASALALTALTTGALAQNADSSSGSKCLRTILIDRTKAPDDRTLLFYMKNGSVYQSTLAANCPQLSIYGFSYVATPPDEICGNLQSIRVIRTGAVCLLGPFVQITPQKAAPNP